MKSPLIFRVFKNDQIHVVKQFLDKDQILFGHEACQELIKFQDSIVKEIGKEKKIPALYHVSYEIESAVRKYAFDNLWDVMQIDNREDRQNKTDEVKKYFPFVDIK